MSIELPDIHANDKQNLRKHRKMLRRVEQGKRINSKCKWFKRNILPAD